MTKWISFDRTRYLAGLSSLKSRGRTRIDRIADVLCGVPRLVSGPRKKPTTFYLPRTLVLSVWLPKSRNGFVAGLLPLAPPEDDNAGSFASNRPLRCKLKT